MSHAAVGNAGHIVHVQIAFSRSLSQKLPVAVTHHFHIPAFVNGCGISEVGPQKRADPHVFLGLSHGLFLFRGKESDFRGAQFALVFVSQIDEGKGLRSRAIGPILFADDQRGSAIFVSGRVKTFFRQNQHGNGTFDPLLSDTDSVHNVFSFRNQSGYQFCVVDASAAHGHKLSRPVFQQVLYDFFFIINPSHRRNGVVALPAADGKGLGIPVADSSDSHIPFHFFDIHFEFAAERGVLNIVDRPVKAVLLQYAHSSPFGSQVRMVVGSEKQIHYAVLF